MMYEAFDTHRCRKMNTDGIDMTVDGTSDDYLLPLRRFADKNRVEIQQQYTRAARAAHC